MSAKAIREYRGKKLISYHVKELSNGKHIIDDRSVLITSSTNLDELVTNEPWLLSPDIKLVVKPDQLIKRRGKAGLVGIKLNWDQVKEWISLKMNTEITLESSSNNNDDGDGKDDGVTGELHTFIVDPFVPHTQNDEYYICIQSDRNGEEILFYNEGGVDVGDVDTKAKRLHVSIDKYTLLSNELIDAKLFDGVPLERITNLSSFIITLFNVYRKLNFTYMEINPIVFSEDGLNIVPLDLAAKIDETASFINGANDWSKPTGCGHLDLPAPFGRKEYPEEEYIRELDSKTGASLKLTVLNEYGRIWTMVAGGGASVVYGT
jgi:ATP citrate (pro-S)-lyase